MIQDVFNFKIVARGRGNGRSRWHVVQLGSTLEVIATLDLVPEAQEWRLVGCGPLAGRGQLWSHNGQPVRNQVHAWVRREVIAQLAAWALAHLRECERSGAYVRFRGAA